MPCAPSQDPLTWQIWSLKAQSLTSIFKIPLLVPSLALHFSTLSRNPFFLQVAWFSLPPGRNQVTVCDIHCD